MITERLIEILLGLVEALLGTVLPEGEPLGIGGAVTGVVHLYGWLNTWAPVAETIALIVLVIEVATVLGAIYVVTWLLRRLHVLGG